jgi:hypothetical protein
VPSRFTLTERIPTMSVYLHLFHGRNALEQDLDTWGREGPTIGPLS